jgi:hypothetical protein
MAVGGSLLEENLDRVIDSVVRNVSAGRGAVPDPDSMDAEPAAPSRDDVLPDAAEARETMADLCGHVAYALKSLEAPHRATATYRAPEAPAMPPTLNLVR